MAVADDEKQAIGTRAGRGGEPPASVAGAAGFQRDFGGGHFGIATGLAVGGLGSERPLELERVVVGVACGEGNLDRGTGGNRPALRR